MTIQKNTLRVKVEVLSLLTQTAGFWQNDGREARYKKLRITCLKYIWYDNLGKRVSPNCDCHWCEFWYQSYRFRL